MLIISGAIGLPSLTKMHKKKALTRICSGLKDQGFKSLNPSFFNASKTPRPLTDFKKTIGIIGAIKKAVIIVAFTDLDFQALSQQFKFIQLIPWYKTIVIGY